MILGYLIFSHLLGDFVFQPDALVKYKMKSVKGVLIHVLIHFIVSLIVLLPFLINGYFWLIVVVAGISFAHFWIDKAKINYDLKNDKKVLPFVIDQLLHFITILVAYFLIRDLNFSLPETIGYQIYTNINIIVFLSFLIFLSSTTETFRYQMQRERNANAQFHPSVKNALKRILVFMVFYVAVMLLSFYATK